MMYVCMYTLIQKKKGWFLNCKKREKTGPNLTLMFIAQALYHSNKAGLQSGGECYIFPFIQPFMVNETFGLQELMVQDLSAAR